jgi:hypothetical protein
MEASTRAEVDEANGLMVVRGVPATVLDTRDANGRIHPRESFERALRQLKKEGAFAGRSLLCTADDHPEQSYPRPAKASHIVIDARIEPGEAGGLTARVDNDWLVLNTQAGRDLRALIEAGATIGTSIRGLGRQDENSGQIEDYTYLGTDAVGQPSAGTFATLTAEAAPQDVARAVVESLETGRMTYDVDEALDRFCEQWGVTASASSGAWTTPRWPQGRTRCRWAPWTSSWRSRPRRPRRGWSPPPATRRCVPG